MDGGCGPIDRPGASQASPPGHLRGVVLVPLRWCRLRQGSGVPRIGLRLIPAQHMSNLGSRRHVWVTPSLRPAHEAGATNLVALHNASRPWYASLTHGQHQRDPPPHIIERQRRWLCAKP